MLTPEELKQFGIDKASLERRYGKLPVKKTKEEEEKEIMALTKGICFLAALGCLVVGSGVLFGLTGLGIALITVGVIFGIGALHNPK